jgi:hypothetical protein
MFNDVPSNEICIEINPVLWNKFRSRFIEIENKEPSNKWSESEVVQYLDTMERDVMQKDIFCLGHKFIYKSQGQMSDMYEVDHSTGDYKPYNSDNLWRDVENGTSVILRPAMEYELEWAERKLVYYHHIRKKIFEEEYLS